MTSEPEVAIFIVRATREGDALRGVVERVKTGEKAYFEDADSIGRVIARIVEAEWKATISGEEDQPRRSAP
jgi:hypothetical protein